MTELLFDNAKYKEWKDTHNFDNCKLDRKDYGEFLTDYITGERDGFVLNLNGSWGAGKTEFLKRMYSELLSRKHPCIYIDAWESDFSKDPLTVVTSELLKQLKLFNFDRNGEESGRKLNEFITKALKGFAIGAAGVVTKKIIDDGTVGVTAMQEWLNEEPDDFVDKLTDEYHEQVDAIKEIRANLTSLAGVLNTTYKAEIPVVVLVDELDRCRPIYAIEMLEVIKHFFNTKNFVFVVATDTEQLSKSIKAVYGSEFESKKYLKRFFDRKATLPEPDIADYLKTYSYNYNDNQKLILYPQVWGSLEESINKSISLLARAFGLHIRDVDQLISKFQSCLRTAVREEKSTGKKQYINYIALLVGLIEQDHNESVYEQRTTYDAPAPLIQNENYKIEDDLTLSRLIDLCMHSITFSEYKEIDKFSRLYTRRRRPDNYHYSEMLERGNISRDYRVLITELRNYAEIPSDGENLIFWDWSKMKKVIELAGRLE